MTPDDVIELAEAYVEDGYDRTVARAFVRAELEPPPLWRIRQIGFAAAEVEVLEAEVKRNQAADQSWGA